MAKPLEQDTTALPFSPTPRHLYQAMMVDITRIVSMSTEAILRHARNST